MSFFESVRLALARHPVGVHVLSSSASEPELLTAEARLSRRLPSPQYREFLLTWNGGSMFHESLVLLPAEQVRVVEEKMAGDWRVQRRATVAGCAGKSGGG
jgi:hypothetical protein